jgi:hypothetical protein
MTKNLIQINPSTIAPYQIATPTSVPATGRSVAAPPARQACRPPIGLHRFVASGVLPLSSSRECRPIKVCEPYLLPLLKKKRLPVMKVWSLLCCVPLNSESIAFATFCSTDTFQNANVQSRGGQFFFNLCCGSFCLSSGQLWKGEYTHLSIIAPSKENKKNI